MKDATENFRTLTGLLKDCWWWIALIVAGYFALRESIGAQATSVSVHVVSAILLFYVTVRAFVYRRRTKRIYKAFEYLHKVNHEIRDVLGKELGFLIDSDHYKFDNVTEEELKTASDDALRNVLQMILDQTGYFFEEVTGAPCTAVLLMPEHDDQNGDHFRARLYSSNATRERVDSRPCHKQGLVFKAFQSTEAVLCKNLRSELKKGNFVRSRGDADPFKWYETALMAHFKVQGERWGVLSVDSKKKNIFYEEYKSILCAFADSCGIAFSLAEHGDLGNEIYCNKKA